MIFHSQRCIALTPSAKAPTASSIRDSNGLGGDGEKSFIAVFPR